MVLFIPLSLVGYRYLPLAAGYVDADSCVGCHRTLNDRLIDQWVDSAHFSARVGCEGCHGRDHDAMFAIDGDVPMAVCAECHPDQAKGFGQSVHARAERDARDNARFLAAPPAIQRQGCLACHAIGQINTDGPPGRCNDCHSSHRFSAEEAREPQACAGCHMGPDHPQIEAWEASKHGIAWNSVRDDRRAPTCSSCHLGGLGGHETISQDRPAMITICRDCHSLSFARRQLADADEIKRIADDLVAEATQIVREIADEGLLVPAPSDRPPHPHAGHAMVLGKDQTYDNTSPIEQRLFKMQKFHRSITFKGAYHFSPDHTHWLGYSELQADLTYIRGEARRIRAAHRSAPPPVEEITEHAPE